MMQQQMCQSDQLSQQPMAQQMSQQMMLCPVKVVYETQILVPPGEQIQPNQTIFINPQNTPPWIQNRMQNQVFYVQQMPNNIVPNMQQNIDPNQMYIQNYPYHIAQQIIAQNTQEQRPMQLQNMPQQYNMMQTVPNVGANLPERTVQMTNLCQMPNQIVPNRQMAPNIGVSMPNQQQPINEVQRTFMNVRPQIHQYLSNARPQVMQNPNVMTQNVGQTFATLPPRPVQISSQNISNIQRMVTTSLPNNPPRVNVATYAASNPVQMAPKVETATNTNIVPKHSIANTVPKTTNVQNYTFKAVQPRPQYRHNVPNIGKLIQPTPHVNATTYKDRVNANNPANVENTQFNRKRKSESPDEVYKKMMINPASRVSNTQTNDTKEAVHSVLKKMLNENTILQRNSNGAHLVKLDEPVTTTSTTSIASQTEKEKLLRNTVFTQAKGRVLSDKEIVPKEIIKTDTKIAKETEVKNEHSITIIKIEYPDEKLSKVEQDIKKEIVKEEIPEKKEPEKKVLAEVKEPKIEFRDKLLNGHQILTHVLDGYVIQESNVAFPIRKPLKEKITSNNGKEIKEEGVDTKDSTIERVPIDLPLLPFHFLQLDNEEEKQESSTKEEIEEKPFTKVQKNIVKSWTVEQLADYMTKHSWNEPASLFRDHEIDGESLFLVSKAQLLHIGISEEHADIICEFVKN
ncbi:uncharacterized protein LOC115449262 [Manduca sexta]|uniref:SAM domain-containing protein n=1 Tax=Manduca sexta TaxID=7130 RepID=A0A922CUS8_MANSE|nr:uncharacterized protein LOC115449262 [Manduca sexta]KAG6459127.1 hypothetical protein O3G_MSEX011190 [Manduca sexta]